MKAFRELRRRLQSRTVSQILLIAQPSDSSMLRFNKSKCNVSCTSRLQNAVALREP